MRRAGDGDVLLVDSSVLTAAIRALTERCRPGFEVSAERATANVGLAPDYIRILDPASGRWAAVLLHDDDIPGAATALDAGASAIITIHSTAIEIRVALGAVEGGISPYLTTSIARGLARGVLGGGRQVPADDHDRWPHPVPHLTHREAEVLALLARGYTNREIAETLVVSVNTVRTHLQSLATKLNGSNRSRIVANALAAGLPEARGILNGEHYVPVGTHVGPDGNGGMPASA